MIEKFSDEEIKQIKKELLGIGSNPKSLLCRNERTEIMKLWENKPVNDFQMIYKIIDITLSNFEIKSKRNKKGIYNGYGINASIKENDKEEYLQMFQEILKIIKKHNRKWEGDNVDNS